MTDQPREIEAALFICSTSPASIADEISALTALGRYRLLARPDQLIRDTHFDAGESALWVKGIALRARQKNGVQLITLKGPPDVAPSGLVSRLEFEAPWNATAVSHVAEQLATAGITLPALPATLDPGDPASSLQQAGFRVIQSRTTHRRVRRIMEAPNSDELAEMAIDAIRYDLPGTQIACYEVEIEAKSANAQAVIEQCTAQLLDHFGAALRPWPYGKLVTGKVIAELLDAGELEPLLEDGGLVGPPACDAIESYMRMARQLSLLG